VLPFSVAGGRRSGGAIIRELRAGSSAAVLAPGARAVAADAITACAGRALAGRHRHVDLLPGVDSAPWSVYLSVHTTEAPGASDGMGRVSLVTAGSAPRPR